MGLFDSIGDALFGGAEKKAAKAAERAAEGQEAIAREGLELIRPSIEAGDEARNLALEALGIRGPEAQQAFFQGFQSDPGFQESVDFGTEAILENRAALGGLKSGATLRGVQDFAQRSRQDAFNRRIQQLLGLSGSGQTAAAQAQTPIANIAGAIGAQGQARASGFTGSADAVTNTINQGLRLGSRIAFGGF